jgi:hypothetical protein
MSDLRQWSIIVWVLGDVKRDRQHDVEARAGATSVSNGLLSVSQICYELSYGRVGIFSGEKDLIAN